MSFTPFDSQIGRLRFHDADLAPLFSDTAEVRAMMLVLGTVAEAQGDAGLIPQDSAFFIKRAAMELQIDPAGLAQGMQQDGTPMPALVTAFRRGMEAPEHAHWIGYGISAQDIMDSAFMLRLRRALGVLEARVKTLSLLLTAQSQKHAKTVMPALGHTPTLPATTFGACIGGWHAPLPRHLERLSQLKPRLLNLGFKSTAFGPEVTADVAKRLALGVHASPAQSDDTVVECASWLAMVAGSMGKIATDLLAATQTYPPLIKLPHPTGGIQAQTALAMAHHAAQLSASIQTAQISMGEADQSMLTLQTLNLSQLVVTCGIALRDAHDAVEGMNPDEAAMRSALASRNGLPFAQAAIIALTSHMRHLAAQDIVMEACANVTSEANLQSLLMARCDAAVDWDTVFDPLA